MYQPGPQQVVVEDAVLSDFVLGQHLDGPDAPHERVQHLTVDDLSHEGGCLFLTEVFGALVLCLNLIWHIFIIVAVQIVAAHLCNFSHSQHVVSEPGYAVLAWVSVVDHGLVDVVGQVVGHRVPLGVLVVDQNQFSVVGPGHQDIVLLRVVVSQHKRECFALTDERLEVFVVAFEQELLFELFYHV